MGNQRTYVTFLADFPDDIVFNEAGDLLVPGGRNICEKLVECMRAEGIPASDPEQYKFYGWEFTASLDGAATWLMLQYPGPWLLMVEDRSVKWSWFRKRKEPSDAALNLIHDTLGKAGKISDISWFTSKEYNSGVKAGSPAP